MLRLLTDHDFGEPIVRGLFARLPDLDLKRAREIGLSAVPDPELLHRAASDGRVILSHDENTLVGHAYERVAQGLPMPGVVLVHQDTPVGRAIEELVAAVYCWDTSDMDSAVRFIPLR